MPLPANFPSRHPRIRQVGSFAELVGTPFADGVNALCWPRTLTGDFDAVLAQIESGEGLETLDATRLRSLSLGGAARAAVAAMLADLELLETHGLAPVLNCIHGYPRDEDSGPVATDVFSFHADSAPVEADTWLCTYFGPASEGLRNEDALRRVDLPETRAELLRLFGGADDDAFREWLNENCYDLHYAPRAGAEPFGFGLGNLWRIATDWPGSPVPPCVHRAPATRPGERRLLLIS